MRRTESRICPTWQVKLEAMAKQNRQILRLLDGLSSSRDVAAADGADGKPKGKE